MRVAVAPAGAVMETPLTSDRTSSTQNEKTMSSPSRMLRGRPIAPLPTQYASKSLNKGEHRKEDVNVKRNSPTFSGQAKASSTHMGQLCCTSVDQITPENSVREYLRFHKNFLEEFILEDVPQEILERMLIRKAQRKNSASGIGYFCIIGWWYTY